MHTHIYAYAIYSLDTHIHKYIYSLIYIASLRMEKSGSQKAFSICHIASDILLLLAADLSEGSCDMNHDDDIARWEKKQD